MMNNSDWIWLNNKMKAGEGCNYTHTVGGLLVINRINLCDDYYQYTGLISKNGIVLKIRTHYYNTILWTRWLKRKLFRGFRHVTKNKK